MRILGTIKDGNLDIDLSKLKRFTERHQNCRVELILREAKSKRSIDQNAYYWGVVIKLLSEQTGYTGEEMHEILKYKFIEKKRIVFDDDQIEYTPSTAKLNTKEFEDYLSEIRQWASDLNVFIPLPNEEVSC